MIIPHRVVVFHQQNGLGAAGDLGFGLGRRRGLRRRRDGRQEDLERGARAELAGDLDPAPVLLDDAIDRRQAQVRCLCQLPWW